MPTCMTWAFTIAFKAVFEILAIFLTLKTIANAIFSICRLKGTEIYHIYGRISEKSFDLY